MDTAERARIAAEAEYPEPERKVVEMLDPTSAYNAGLALGSLRKGYASATSKHLKLHEKSMEYMQHSFECTAENALAKRDPDTRQCVCGLDAHLSTLRAEIEPK